MGRPITEDFAQVDSEHEIVVHLGNVADEMSVYELAELLAMPARQIVVALARVGNEAIRREMYRRLRETIGVLVPGGGLVLDEPMPIPAEDEIDADQVDDWLLLIYSHYGPDSTWNWFLPSQDLFLPLTPNLLDQLDHLAVSGPRPDRIYEIKRVEDDPNLLESLLFRTDRLEAAIEAKLDDVDGGDRVSAVLAGVQMAKNVVEFQHKHWWSERVKGRITSDSEKANRAGLAPLEKALDAIADAAIRDFEETYLRDEQREADALLDLLSPTTGDQALHVLIKRAFTDRTSMSAKLRSQTVDATLRALRVLARSSRTERFVREHVIDMLEEAGTDLGPAAREVLLAEGREVGKHAVESWEAALARLREGADATNLPDSPMRLVQRGIRVYRLGLSGVSALLEQGVVAQVFVFLAKGGTYDASAIRRLGWEFGALLLRSLAADAVQHRMSHPDEIVVPGIRRFNEMIRTLGQIDQESPAAGVALGRAHWMKQGERLRDLQVRPAPRSAGGAGTRVGVSTLAFVLATHTLDTDDMSSKLAFVSASLNLSEHTLRAAEFVVYGPPIFDNISRFDQWMKGLSAAAALFGGAASGLRAHRALQKGRNVEAALEAANGAASLGIGIGQAMMARVLGEGLVASGAVVNAWAVAIAITVFIAQLGYEQMVNVGTRPVLESVLRHLDQLPQCRKLRTEIGDAIDSCGGAADFLVPLTKYPGDVHSPARGGSPTYWQAAKAGFSKASIVKMFDAPPKMVAIYLSPMFDREPTRDGGPLEGGTEEEPLS